MNPGKISIQSYDYELPADKIARFPLSQRDDSRLLLNVGAKIEATIFSELPNHIPAGSMLVFNNSKVINARISFQKPSGTSMIEIFCLEPANPINEYTTVMRAKGSSLWKCFVGGASKWKSGLLEKKIFIDGREVLLSAEKIRREADAYFIRFDWNPTEISFAEVLEASGDTPLPPYIKRETTLEDTSRYQTIYAKDEGSVAAPTAGLHFSTAIFETLQKKGINKTYVTLHVGAGTFKPVKAGLLEDHEMHAEYIDVSSGAIHDLLLHENVVAVGTTSLRVIESLYWIGVNIVSNPDILKLEIGQWDVYQTDLEKGNISKKEALEALLDWMKKKNKERIFTKTQIMIVPGYQFRIARMLVTNFHQPQSTLLLLVAAAIGEAWKKMYAYALENDFRFLSYGDANLIKIQNTKDY